MWRTPWLQSNGSTAQAARSTGSAWPRLFFATGDGVGQEAARDLCDRRQNLHHGALVLTAAEHTKKCALKCPPEVCGQLVRSLQCGPELTRRRDMKAKHFSKQFVDDDHL